MLCYVMLCCVMLCYGMLCYIISHYIISYSIALNYLTLYYIISGAYAYIEASSPRVQGDVARLQTKPLYASRQICLTFFYHMMAAKSNMMGKLNVYIEEKGSKTLIFTQDKPQGNEWIRQALNLTPKGFFKVRNFSKRHYLMNFCSICRCGVIQSYWQ